MAAIMRDPVPRPRSPGSTVTAEMPRQGTPRPPKYCFMSSMPSPATAAPFRRITRKFSGPTVST
jgi:hypothetical protein